MVPEMSCRAGFFDYSIVKDDERWINSISRTTFTRELTPGKT